MSKIYIQTSNAEQWAQFLAEPDKHWRQGYSVRILAYSWQEANGFPSEVASVLETQFPSTELLLALPEHQVSITRRFTSITKRHLGSCPFRWKAIFQGKSLQSAFWRKKPRV